MAREGRPSGLAGLASAMDMEEIVHISSSLEENGRNSSLGLGKGEGQKEEKEGSTEAVKGSVKGLQKLGQCLPKSSEILVMIINSEGLASHIQYMKDNALIAKFVGIWPVKKPLVWWINNI